MPRINGNQGGEFSYVAAPEHLGDAVTITVNQPPRSDARWKIRLYVRLDPGTFFVAFWHTPKPTEQGYAAQYILGGAVVPGAHGWIVHVDRDLESGDDNSWIDVSCTSSRNAVNPQVTTFPTYLPEDE